MKRKYDGVLIHESRDELGIIEVVQEEFCRSLHFGSPPKQSSMRLDDPAALVLDYTRAMMSGLLFCPEPGAVLLLGLGGGSLAKFLLHQFPRCRVDAVDCRDSVVKLAYGYFQLPEHETRLRVTIDEAGRFVREADESAFAGYDLVLVDAFDEAGMVEEVAGGAFFDACRARMSREGVLVANLWTEQKAAVRETLAALGNSFQGQVLRLPVAGKGNVVAVATQEAAPRRRLKRLGETARAMENRYGLEFPRLLQALRKANRGLFF